MKKKLNVTSIQLKFLICSFIYCMLLKNWRGDPWYFHLSYKVKKSASCQKRGEGEAASLTPTPDATCLWCKHMVCSGVFAWSQLTDSSTRAQNLWMRHYGARSCYYREPRGGGQMNFWHLFCNSYIHVYYTLVRMFWKKSIELWNTFD